MRKLHMGAAYHGNRMPHHAYTDLLDMATSGMDTVVHMLSHTDWERHKNVMREIVSISTEVGLETWVDNWGIGGPPGDKSHFLAYYPESHMYLSDGRMDKTHACVNSPEFRAFTKEWIDAVYDLGARHIFWDEPHMPQENVNGKKVYGCCCARCRKLFAEQYGKEMPFEADETTAAFGAASIADYFREVTEYSHKKGMTNAVCVMLGTYGMSLETVDRICELPYMDNIGSDPYWVAAKKENPDVSPYQFVYDGVRENLRVSELYGKDHNLWIQLYRNPRGLEDDVIQATEAAYDAGARTILAWGYYGSESNDYAAENAPVAWSRYKEAVMRVRGFEHDRILAENRKLYKK